MKSCEFNIIENYHIYYTPDYISVSDKLLKIISLKSIDYAPECSIASRQGKVPWYSWKALDLRNWGLIYPSSDQQLLIPITPIPQALWDPYGFSAST